MKRDLTALRHVSADQHHRDLVGRWLDARGQVHQLQPLPQSPCLRLEVDTAEGTVQLLVQANNWARANCAELEGSAWSLLPADALGALVAACTSRPLHPELFPVGAAPRCIGLVSTQAGQALPCLGTALGPVWIESICGPSTQAIRPVASPELSLELRLRPLHLPPHLVHALRCGDVLRLGVSPVTGTAWVGQHLLHTFTFKDNHVEINSNLLPEGTEANLAAQDGGNSLGSLSITLDVVLAHLPITLDSLQELGKGSVLELPASAHLNVRVRDAGRLLAVGELVQIGDQLAVQLRSMATSS